MGKLCGAKRRLRWLFLRRGMLDRSCGRLLLDEFCAVNGAAGWGDDDEGWSCCKLLKTGVSCWLLCCCVGAAAAWRSATGVEDCDGCCSKGLGGIEGGVV